MTELEKSLSDAMTHARVRELPQTIEIGNNNWAKAIVLVRKSNNKRNYAVAYNNGEGNPQIVADFGSAAVIREILEIRPYFMKAKLYTPTFRDKEEVVIYLVNHGEKESEIRKLISDVNPNKKPKSEKKLAEDKLRIKTLVNKYAIIDQNAIDDANHRAYDTTHYDEKLPEIKEETKPEVKEESNNGGEDEDF